MKALRITSSSARAGRTAGEGTYAHTGAPAAALSASTRVASAASRGWPNFAEFSTSSRDTMLAPSRLMPVTIFACCRWKLTSFAAPRGPSRCTC
ncbi:hypothetical protein [Dactylosporangium cerinum]